MDYDPWDSWPWGFPGEPPPTLKWWEYAIALGILGSVLFITAIWQPWLPVMNG